LCRHSERLMDGLSHIANVPWVDYYRAVERLCSTCKLGQDHNTMTLLLGGDVLVRDEVHAVSRGRNKADIGASVHSKKLLEVDTLMQEVNWNKLDGSLKASVSLWAPRRLILP